MIFGAPYMSSDSALLLRLNAALGTRHFAIFNQLSDGRFIFMQHYYKYAVINVYKSNNYFKSHYLLTQCRINGTDLDLCDFEYEYKVYASKATPCIKFSSSLEDTQILEQGIIDCITKKRDELNEKINGSTATSA